MMYSHWMYSIVIFFLWCNVLVCVWWLLFSYGLEFISFSSSLPLFLPFFFYFLIFYLNQSLCFVPFCAIQGQSLLRAVCNTSHWGWGVLDPLMIIHLAHVGPPNSSLFDAAGPVSGHTWLSVCSLPWRPLCTAGHWRGRRSLGHYVPALSSGLVMSQRWFLVLFFVSAIPAEMRLRGFGGHSLIAALSPLCSQLWGI